MPKIRVTIDYVPENWPEDHCLEGGGCHLHGCPWTRATCPNAVWPADIAKRLLQETDTWRSGLVDSSSIEDIDPTFTLTLQLLKEGT